MPYVFLVPAMGMRHSGDGKIQGKNFVPISISISCSHALTCVWRKDIPLCCEIVDTADERKCMNRWRNGLSNDNLAYSAHPTFPWSSLFFFFFHFTTHSPRGRSFSTFWPSDAPQTSSSLCALQPQPKNVWDQGHGSGIKKWSLNFKRDQDPTCSGCTHNNL